MSLDYSAILKAHKLANKALMIWGSSGFGKSSKLESYAKQEGMEVVKVMACYIDPMAILVPRINNELGFVQYYPAEWLHKLMTTKVPSMLFLDEFNRAPSPQTMAFLTELLLDRSIAGNKIADCVQIVAAANLSEEDVGVIEVPNAIMNRLTHIVLAPSINDIITGMRAPLAKAALKVNSKVVSKPSIPDGLKYDACPRQIDACCELFETGVLSGEELGVVCRGRLGVEQGNLLASILVQLKNKEKQRLPSEVLPKYFKQINEVEREGQAIEVATLLKDCMATEKQKRHVADYLLQYASPEIVRSLHQAKFNYVYPADKPPLDLNGKPYVSIVDSKPMEKGGAPFQIYALRIGKLTPKSET